MMVTSRSFFFLEITFSLCVRSIEQRRAVFRHLTERCIVYLVLTLTAVVVLHTGTWRWVLKLAHGHGPGQLHMQIHMHAHMALVVSSNGSY